jgi:2-oxoglutarate ferredoxin oxidoreductase subunit alpha
VSSPSVSCCCRPGQAGGRGLLRKAFGPQIRGGESAALLKLTDHERYTAADRCDLLLALDWKNFTRFGDEIRLHGDSLVICADATRMPEAVGLVAAPSGVALHRADPRGAPRGPREHAGPRRPRPRSSNLPEALVRLATGKLARKAEAYREAAQACIAAGLLRPRPRCRCRSCPSGAQLRARLVPERQPGRRLRLRCARAFALSPPTRSRRRPTRWSTSPHPLERLGGALVQAEDELAAINMALGAAYGGVPAFTATSGPGLALMTESLGLAVASETPVTVLNVMRGGPSTGIPTKSEQSDLDIALHGLHGDAPHLVLAPLSIGDCVFTTGWAVQCGRGAAGSGHRPLGPVPRPLDGGRIAAARGAGGAGTCRRRGGDGYLRYLDTDSGISPRAAPGMPGLRFTADGLEHNERGTPSAGAAITRRSSTSAAQAGGAATPARLGRGAG